MARRVEECGLCGLGYTIEDGSIDVGDDLLRLFRCVDSFSCAERWLLKFLDGRPLRVESVRLVSKDSNALPSFEVTYNLKPGGLRTRRFTLEVGSPEDGHRWTDHYHLTENGADLTRSFVP